MKASQILEIFSPMANIWTSIIFFGSHFMWLHPIFLKNKFLNSVSAAFIDARTVSKSYKEEDNLKD